MPRLRRAKNKAIVASGRMVAVGGNKGQRYKPRAENWQEACWIFYDTIPEYHQAVTWIANVTSRAVLQVQDENGGISTDVEATDLLEELYGGGDYHPEMLRLLAIHLTVAGECYLIAWDDAFGKTTWEIRAPQDVTLLGDTWKIGHHEIPDSQAKVIRIWKPHPRRPHMADSPSRSVLPVLTEIDGFTKHVNAQIDSRLAGNGILFLPDDIDFATQQTQVNDSGDEVTASPDGIQGFADELVETMDQAIKDPASAAAMSPIVASVAGESIKNIKHVTFSTPLQQQAQAMRNDAVHRLALGMDMPPEALTGTADMNHWGAWAIDEAAIKSHAEPFLAVITSSLTEGYLTPLLEADGSALAELVMIGADTSELRLRPNRSQEAKDLWDRGVVSDTTLRRETGFDEVDEMDKDNQVTWLARKLVLTSSPTPEMLSQILKVLGFPVEGVDKDGPLTTRITETERVDDGTKIGALPAAPKKARPVTPGTSQRPVQPGPPDIQDAAAAAGVLVYRALERAGNKLRNSRAVLRATEGVAPNMVYLKAEYPLEAIPALLDGAWDQLNEFDLSVPPQKLAKWLQAYTTRLLTEKLTYSPESVGQYIRSEMVLTGMDVER